MRKIVLSAVVAIVATVGVYHIARVMGTSEHLASMAAVATTFSFAMILATAMVATTATFAMTATMTAFVVATATNIIFVNDVLAKTGFSLVAALTAIISALMSLDAAMLSDVRDSPGVVLVLYVLEVVTIGIALTRQDASWSIATALGGMAVVGIVGQLIKKSVSEVVSNSPERPST